MAFDITRKEYEVYRRFGVEKDVKNYVRICEFFISNFHSKQVTLNSAFMYLQLTFVLPLMYMVFLLIERNMFSKTTQFADFISRKIKSFQELDLEYLFKIMRVYDKRDLLLSSIKNNEIRDGLKKSLDGDGNNADFAYYYRNCDEREELTPVIYYIGDFLNSLEFVKSLSSEKDSQKAEDSLSDFRDLIKSRYGVVGTPYDASGLDSTPFESVEQIFQLFHEQFSEQISVPLKLFYSLAKYYQDLQVITINKIVRQRDKDSDGIIKLIYCDLVGEYDLDEGEVEDMHKRLMEFFKSRTDDEDECQEDEESHTSSFVRLEEDTERNKGKRPVTVFQGVIDPTVEANLERLIDYLVRNGYIDGTPEIICSFASRLTGKYYKSDVATPIGAKITWKKNTKHLCYILANATDKSTKWQEVKARFEAKGLDTKPEVKAGNVDPESKFAKDLVPYGITKQVKKNRKVK